MGPREKVCDSIAQTRINDKFLPGLRIPDCVAAYNDPAETLADADIVVNVVPSQHCRALVRTDAVASTPETIIVSAAKGLEETSLLRMTEVIAQVLESGGRHPARIGALSGPSFALEAARGDPTAITIASQDSELARIMQQEFSGCQLSRLH